MSTKIAKGVGLSSIMVKDINKAKKLFVDTLGLDLIGGDPQYNWLEIGINGTTYIGVGSPSTECDSMQALQPGHNAIISIEVNNVDEARNALKDKLQFVGDTVEIPGQVKLALFKDDDGNLFYLVEKLG